MIDLETARREVDRAPSGTFADEFTELFARHGAESLERHAGGHHVTASCLVFDPIAESVLLNHHGEARLGGRLGGHLEPVGGPPRAAAQGGAEEEGGLTELPWVPPAPIDPPVHDLSTAFEPCTRHY